MRHLLSFALFILFVSPAIRAQEPFWQPTDGPPGARIEHVAYDPINGVTLAANRTTLFRLRPGERRWEEVFAAPALITDLHVHSTGEVFLSTTDVYYTESTLWRSADAGASWSPASIPAQPGSILLGTDPTGILYAASGSNLFRSDDAGQTWEARTAPHVPGPAFFAVGPEGHLIAMAVYTASAVSSDGGWTWLADHGFTDTAVLSFAADRSGTCYAGLQNMEVNWSVRTFACADTLSWETGSSGLNALIVYALSPTPDGAMLAGTYGGGIYRTDDHGLTWQHVGLDGRYVLSLATGPGGLLLAGTTEGVYRTDDASATWTLLNDGLDRTDVRALLSLPEGDLLAGTEGGGLFRYKPSLGWEQQPSPDAFVYFLHRATSGSLFAGTENGLYHSDDGVAWDTLYIPHGRQFVHDLAFRTLAETPNGVLFAGAFEVYDARFGEIYRSTDSGQTWHSTGFVQIPFRMPVTVSHLVATPDGSMLNVGRGIFRFNVADTTWTDIALTAYGQFSSAAAATDGSMLFAAETALLRLDEDGVTWHVVTDEIRDARALAVNADGHIFAATPYGVFRSTNDGATWTDVGGGLDGAAVQVLALDAEGILWAGTQDRGVYQSVASTVTARDEQPHAATARLTGFPNPFTDAATIRVVLSSAGPVRLTLYDVRGRSVARLVDEWRPNGAFEVALDGHRLPAGVYFYTLEAEGRRVTQPIVLTR